MVYVVIAVIVLHIISLPIVVSVTVYADSDRDDGEIKIKLFFIPVFTKRIDIAAIKRKLGVDERYSQSRSGNDYKTDDEPDNEQAERSSGTAKKFVMDLGFNILSRIRVRAADLDLKIGLGDAAASAMTVGTIKIAYADICAFFGFDRGNVIAIPEYDTEHIYIDFFGIFSISFADIIYAAIVAIVSALRRKTDKRRYYANTVAE